MNKYMIVALIDGITTAEFTNSHSTAEKLHQDIVCGMGGRAEVYIRKYNEAAGDYEYVLLFA